MFRTNIRGGVYHPGLLRSVLTGYINMARVVVFLMEGGGRFEGRRSRMMPKTTSGPRAEVGYQDNNVNMEH